MSASIRGNGSPTPLLVTTGTLVTLSNFSNTGVLGWLWELLDAPEGSAAAISSANAASPTITPDVDGGDYFVKLTTYKDASRTIVDATDRFVITVNFATIPHLDGLPAAGETKQSDLSLGWKARVNRFLTKIRAMVAGLLSDPGTYYAVVTFNAAVNDVVMPIDYASGLPKVQKALGNDGSGLPGILELGVVVGPAEAGGPLTNGSTVIVRRAGTQSAVNVAGSPAAGQAVYLSDTGTMSTSVGTFARTLGLILSGAGSAWNVLFLAGAVRWTSTLWLAGAVQGDNALQKITYAGFALGSGSAAVMTAAYGWTWNDPVTVVSVRIDVKTNNLTTSTTLSVLRNGSQVGSTATVNAGTTGTYKIDGPFKYVPGDTFDVKFDNTAGTATKVLFAVVAVTYVEAL